MFEPKVPVIAAAVGFVLSFLVGLFSGAAFPAFLFRAIGMAFFLGTVVAILCLVAGKFLPELLESGEINTSNGSLSDTGRQVDLTIGDEDDGAISPFANAKTDSEPSSSADLHAAEELREGQAVSKPEENPGSKKQDSVPVDTTAVHTEVPVSDLVKETAQPENKPKPKGGVSGLDVLPDLQDFVPDEKVVEEDASDIDDSVVQSSGMGFSVPEVSSDGVETETMARAIRTILSKDN